MNLLPDPSVLEEQEVFDRFVLLKAILISPPFMLYRAFIAPKPPSHQDPLAESVFTAIPNGNFPLQK